mgnify:CR=1 FL=1
MMKISNGTADFEKIRMDGAIYVDKTDLVYDLTHESQYVFLSRPRRFGKSLLCSTLQYYFEGQKELFKGLRIADMEDEWKQYPDSTEWGIGWIPFVFKNDDIESYIVEECDVSNSWIYFRIKNIVTGNVIESMYEYSK